MGILFVCRVANRAGKNRKHGNKPFLKKGLKKLKTLLSFFIFHVIYLYCGSVILANVIHQKLKNFPNHGGGFKGKGSVILGHVIH